MDKLEALAIGNYRIVPLHQITIVVVSWQAFFILKLGSCNSDVISLFLLHFVVFVFVSLIFFFSISPIICFSPSCVTHFYLFCPVSIYPWFIAFLWGGWID